MGSGYLDSGWISFGTIERKGLVELEVGTLPLPTATSVRAEVIDDQYDTVAAGTQAVDGERQFYIDLAGEEVYQCALRLSLDTADSSVTPTIQRWRMRAFPIVPPVSEWLLPILVYQSVVVNIGQGEEMSQQVADVQSALHALWASKSVVMYREGGRTYRVRVDAYEFIAHDWDDAGNALNGIMVVQLVEA